MSKKIAKKKVIKKKATKKTKTNQTETITPIKNEDVSAHLKSLVKISKSKSVNHLFSRDERHSQDLFLIADIGKEVEISSEEIEFINKAFEDFKKAQEILKRYA